MRTWSHIKWSFLVAGLVGLCLPVGAGLIYDNFGTAWNSGFANSGQIPDYNYQNPAGWQDSRELSFDYSSWAITDVRLTVNISGGYNGDLYGYLRHDDGVNPVGFIVLLDRPGYAGSGSGYANPGFGLTDGGSAFVFSSSATGTHEVENYQDYTPTYNTSGQLTGTWKPNAGEVTFASAFENLNPNGRWTIFFQDLATGDQSTVVSWGLQIEAVPEPVNVALLVFGAIGGTIWGVRRFVARRKV